MAIAVLFLLAFQNICTKAPTDTKSSLISCSAQKNGLRSFEMVAPLTDLAVIPIRLMPSTTCKLSVIYASHVCSCAFYRYNGLCKPKPSI